MICAKTVIAGRHLGRVVVKTNDMFSYYGSKSKVVDYYPPPKHKKIIEPFAGSARYSLKYWQNDVLLVDKYPVIIGIWNYLIQATKHDILSLPDLKSGDNVDSFNISQEEKWLIGFCINGGSAQPKKTAKDYNTWGDAKPRIAQDVQKIKHWKAIVGCYDELNNEEATWFVDPPYQFGGEWYVKSTKDIDFVKLADWCKSRNGQIIVCENTKADWLPFKPMVDMQGAVYKTTEAIWSNHRTNYDAVQQSLF
jgi:site-specific DNA-adenine methylase